MSNMQEINDERDRARQIIEYTSTHLFLTGKAGTGKTTFLRQLRQDAPKRMIVLAPTGIAAINAGGSTIHSFFQLPFAPFIPDEQYRHMDFKLRKQKIKLIRSLDLIVIDEISMVRADLLDQIDAVLRQYRNSRQPFGGVQLLMIGDLQQLAPVAKEEEWSLLSKYYDSPYFFSSHALSQTQYVTIELQKVYRQSDPVFLGLLNRIRSNKADSQVLEQLNKRYIPGFLPPSGEKYIRLVTHNFQAQQINEGELSKIKETTYTFKASIEGTFPEYSYPTDATLSLKRGAQIMFVKNDAEHRYFNGSLGEIVDISEENCTVRTTEGNFEIQLVPEEWLNTKYALNEKTQQIEERIDGRFHQYPIKLAWAITIHKSQGLTFEHAIIDAHSAFAHGQTYVALSRCKTLEGMVLSSPIPASAIIQDRAVCAFNEQVELQQPTTNDIEELRQQHQLQLINNLFDFSTIRHALGAVIRLMEEHFYQIFPETLKRYQVHLTTFDNNILTVAQKFSAQYHRLVADNHSATLSDELQERIQKGAAYFSKELLPLQEFAKYTLLSTDNKDVQKRSTSLMDDLNQALAQKYQLLSYVSCKGFDILQYQKCKAITSSGQSITTDGKVDITQQPENKASSKVQEKLIVPNEIHHPELYENLYLWRKQKAKAEKLPVYQIIQNKAMIGISNILPADAQTLSRIPYFGPKGLEKYGEEILEIVHSYVKKEKIGTPQLHLFEPQEKEETTNKPVKKEPKEESFKVTLNLYQKGHDKIEIARLRGLAVTTIESHLTQAVEKGLLPLETFVSPQKVRDIEKYLREQPQGNTLTLTEIRKAMGENYEFFEIRLVKNMIKQRL